MNKLPKWVVPTVITGVVVLVLIIMLMNTVGTRNTANLLINQFEAQKKAIELNFDRVWKTIKQKARISEKYSNDFKEIYIGGMKERYSSGAGKMMLWIKEHNSTLSVELYKDLGQTIESNRLSFEREQKKAVSIAQQYRNMNTTVPTKWYLFGMPDKLEQKLITSTKSKNAVETGVDNGVDLFGKEN